MHLCMPRHFLNFDLYERQRNGVRNLGGKRELSRCRDQLALPLLFNSFLCSLFTHDSSRSKLANSSKGDECDVEAAKTRSDPVFQERETLPRASLRCRTHHQGPHLPPGSPDVACNPKMESPHSLTATPLRTKGNLCERILHGGT